MKEIPQRGGGDSSEGQGNSAEEITPEKECYNNGGYSYTQAAGCLSRDEYQSKVANAKRKCEGQEGYEWIAPYGTGDLGTCRKTSKQANKDCQAEKGKDFEWDSKKGECVKKEKAAKNECEAKGSEYTYVDGKCVTKQENCESRAPTVSSGKSIWKNGKCITEREANEQECKAKGSDYIYTRSSTGIQHDSCMTKKENCERSHSVSQGKFIWKDGKCTNERDIKKQECKDKGKDYKFYDDGVGGWSCNKTSAAQKRECENTPGYFWSNEFSKCIKED